jgi:hypothetical protein
MRPYFVSSILICTLAIFISADAAPAATESKQAVALWLSQQLHSQIEASQVLVSPGAAALEGCVITRARPAQTGATSLSLRCPERILPQLVLLNISVDAAPHIPAAPPPIVRAGATLHADWRTESMHAEIPVIAIDSGALGAEIRVRIARSDRIIRARILGAHIVSIVAAGPDRSHS